MKRNEFREAQTALDGSMPVIASVAQRRLAGCSSAANWLGSPQHVMVGAVLALVVYFVGRWRRLALPAWAAVVLAIGVVSTAEILLELIEYPTMYAGKFHYSAYYDTLADMASSVAGALIGAALAVPLGRRFASR